MGIYRHFTALKILKITGFFLIMLLACDNFFAESAFIRKVPALMLCIYAAVELCIFCRARRDYQKLYQAAYFDALTGIPNRLSADLYIRQCASSPEITVAMADLDGLKLVNDMSGHLAGDSMIRDFAVMFYNSALPGAYAFRNGGDEFLAVFSGKDSRQAAARFCASLKEAVTRYNHSAVHPISYSIGCASRSEYPDTSVSQLISYADSRMYHDKYLKKRYAQADTLSRKEEPT